MIFEKIDDDFNRSEVRYKTLVDEKILFIHITQEAWDDCLERMSVSERMRDIEAGVLNKLLIKEFVGREDKVGVPYRAVLLTATDF